MRDPLTHRLNQILPKLTSDDFLRARGIGNEIAFYIFDYAPEDELRIREHIRFLLDHLPKNKPNLRVAHVNLLDFLIHYLKERNLLEKVLGEIQGTRANDFSKIQGRFRTRLSLSSANVDEVIQERLLAKREEVRHDLEAEYAKQGDILKNQLSFKDAGMTFPQFRDADDFVRDYPFAPYQFKLLQKIFESIRKAGATGLHLAQGERSLLDAFQHAGQSVSHMEVGILVPLYRFYPSIESFLDTTVKRTIDQARFWCRQARGLAIMGYGASQN